ncbi:SRPBCC family protein [Actinomadura madurae]|uniref:SRPBCC family protein n=1 Tax=Actinomadura madurae TaxID=1993 RepID=UPI0020D21FAE|nr:carbon monoxide dehydrogenase subunit G [Actinomadura madurae]MCP9954922.1 carbon monoxide dehydrogenase subunit G [Actinomadura madurae]MCP9971664.1 carbon monoxide dehydrogenase subunit G [Actinomadura madurae]MCP9984160.1 carbon monoxide dehydrogenase subunit G [Actinomadura madurae]MCQ0004283.1 carbon monoxide dehydrogenase subunit G [Actinomadura madurae]
MQLTGSASVAAPLDRVWDALQDPAVLARTIPGCSSLEETAPDTYRMTVTAGVASIKGTYVGRVELAEPDPPRSFVLRARGQGAPGTVDATVRVRLSNGDGGTRIDYDADAVVGGMVGGVGQRMLGGVAKRTAGEFFAAVERDLTAPAPVVSPAPPDAPPAAPPGPAQAGPVYPGRAPAVPDRTAPPETNAAWPMAAAFVSGGAVALAGVAVGYLLGRRGR